MTSWLYFVSATCDALQCSAVQWNSWGEININLWPGCKVVLHSVPSTQSNIEAILNRWGHNSGFTILVGANTHIKDRLTLQLTDWIGRVKHQNCDKMLCCSWEDGGLSDMLVTFGKHCNPFLHRATWYNVSRGTQSQIKPWFFLSSIKIING